MNSADGESQEALFGYLSSNGWSYRAVIGTRTWKCPVTGLCHTSSVALAIQRERDETCQQFQEDTTPEQKRLKKFLLEKFKEIREELGNYGQTTHVTMYSGIEGVTSNLNEVWKSKDVDTFHISDLAQSIDKLVKDFEKE